MGRIFWAKFIFGGARPSFGAFAMVVREEEKMIQNFLVLVTLDLTQNRKKLG